MLGEAITKEQIFGAPITGDPGLLASLSHEAAAVATVTMGFSTDPVARWFYPKAADYLRWFPKFVRGFAGGAIQSGTAYCSANYSGVALWLAPGVEPDEDAIFQLVRESIPVDRQADIFELFEQMGAGHPDGPHWYLPMIAVDTFQQGNGVGTELMQQALNRVDLDGLPAYLESSNPRNISLYRRLGFEVIGEITAGGSPPLVPMLRKAQR